MGKGLTVETWVNYAPLESLLYYLFQSPGQAKRLFWGIVPKSVDDYLAALRQYPSLDAGKQPDSAIWHIFDQGRQAPEYNTSINFSLINNLISALGADDAGLALDYLKRYDPPSEKYLATGADERGLLQRIYERLAQSDGLDETELQAIPFEVAKEAGMPPQELFKMFYEVTLGQERGPRFGTFARLLGKSKMLALLEGAIHR